VSRMLEALKALENRAKDSQLAAAGQLANEKKRRAQSATREVSALEAERARAADVMEPATTKTNSAACLLGAASELPDEYLELAANLGEQNSANYCNVFLFITPDGAESCFSLPRLAQAVALQSPGDVLLVDGDLRGRRLTKAAGLQGAGLSEVMSGVANWSDVVVPTNVACVDVVSAGMRQVPTLERPDFGWHALRPQYRAVLIGVAAAGQPETVWLASRCDSVYVVIRKSHTKRQSASGAISALRACGANVLGCIVAEA
jgi:Mrp family chromosome partitioning ATPase